MNRGPLPDGHTARSGARPRHSAWGRRHFIDRLVQSRPISTVRTPSASVTLARPLSLSSTIQITCPALRWSEVEVLAPRLLVTPLPNFGFVPSNVLTVFGQVLRNVIDTIAGPAGFAGCFGGAASGRLDGRDEEDEPDVGRSSRPSPPGFSSPPTRSSPLPSCEPSSPVGRGLDAIRGGGSSLMSRGEPWAWAWHMNSGQLPL